MLKDKALKTREGPLAMTKSAVAVFAFVLSLGQAQIADSQQAPEPSQVTTWAQSLKCRDLFVEGGTEPNLAVLGPFAIWLNGYMSGLGSALQLDRLPAFHFFDWSGDFIVLVLTSCQMKKVDSAVDTAIDAAGLVVNTLSKKPVLLRGTDGKWE